MKHCFNHAEGAWSKITCDFCEQCEIDFNLATNCLQEGTFNDLCKQKHCEETANAGRCSVDNCLENVLDNLDIRAHEFC